MLSSFLTLLFIMSFVVLTTVVVTRRYKKRKFCGMAFVAGRNAYFKRFPLEHVCMLLPVPTSSTLSSALAFVVMHRCRNNNNYIHIHHHATHNNHISYHTFTAKVTLHLTWFLPSCININE